MNFYIERDINAGRFGFGRVIRFHGSFTERELEELPLDPLERALLNDKHESAADYLLALECIYRAYEEARKAKEPGG